MSSSKIASTPEPPYYAVIFTSRRTAVDDGYKKIGEKMFQLAEQQAGFIGFESFPSIGEGTSGEENLSCTISYWEDAEAIQNWKSNVDHMAAQETGKENWYEEYKVRVSKVERDYGFSNANSN